MLGSKVASKEISYAEEDVEDQGTPEDSTCSMFGVTSQVSDPIFREVRINQVPVKMN